MMGKFKKMNCKINVPNMCSLKNNEDLPITVSINYLCTCLSTILESNSLHRYFLNVNNGAEVCNNGALQFNDGAAPS